jgi:hypothetical protein
MPHFAFSKPRSRWTLNSKPKCLPNPVSTEVLTPRVVGEGSPVGELTPATLAAIVEQALEVAVSCHVLAIVPDKLRRQHGSTFPHRHKLLTKRS